VQSNEFFLVADDVVGGAFAINGRALGPTPGNVFYFAPDRLTWEDMVLGYSAFVQWVFEGDLQSFYENMRWPGWEKEVEHVPGDHTLSLAPPPWTSEGRDLSKVSRRAVPAREAWVLQQEFARQLGPPPSP
jgi:hypothetical protein